MKRGNELEDLVFDTEHIEQVLNEIAINFPGHFDSFSQQPLDPVFQIFIEAYEKEQEAYREYLDFSVLDEFEFDPNAFKTHTRNNCPIIRRCLRSQDEVMKDYKRAFHQVSGRDLLNAVRNISEFGNEYAKVFDDETHEDASSPDDLDLEILNEGDYGTLGVIGYGIQSSLLYGLYPREFAHRPQNAVWALYFLSGRQDFGLVDGSEFLMIREELGTCEQNYIYPAQMFGFYALQVFNNLREACSEIAVQFSHQYRYVYLEAFFDHVANRHREDINAYTQSSEYVESRPWF